MSLEPMFKLKMVDENYATKKRNILLFFVNLLSTNTCP